MTDQTSYWHLKSVDTPDKLVAYFKAMADGHEALAVESGEVDWFHSGAATAYAHAARDLEHCLTMWGER